MVRQTGWRVEVNLRTNQQTLGAAVETLRPPGVREVTGPSFFVDQQEVSVWVEGGKRDDLESFAGRYLELMGFRLLVEGRGVEDD